MLLSHKYSDKLHDELLDDSGFELLIIGRDLSPEELSIFKEVCQGAITSHAVDKILISIEEFTQSGISAMAFIPVVANVCSGILGAVSTDFKDTLERFFQVMKENLSVIPLGWCVFIETQRAETSEALRAYRYRQEGAAVVSLSSGNAPKEYCTAPYQLRGGK